MMFSKTAQVALELSNLCQYAGIHKKCPLRFAGDPVYLPGKIVYDVLGTLGRHGFEGTIVFDVYNEPLVDPRLFQFVAFAHEACPRSELCIWTNGRYLNQALAEELADIGLSRIRVSAYSRAEHDRLAKIRPSIRYDVVLRRLDDRLRFYKRRERPSSVPCFAPLTDIIIAREGCISLCCHDWERRHTWGDLREQTFEEVMRSGELQAVYERLSRGDRFLYLCKRCGLSRASSGLVTR